MKHDQKHHNLPSTDMVTGASVPHRRQEHVPGPALSDNDRDALNKVFGRLTTIFTGWRAAYPTEKRLAAGKQEFAKALIENGITSQEQIALGMRRARQENTSYFPSPGQFVAWCQPTPEDMGLPTVEQAFWEANNHRASHPAVELASLHTGYDRTHLPAAKYRPVFERAYLALVRRVVQGDDLEQELVKALPPPEQPTHKWEHYQQLAKKNINQIKRLLGKDEQEGHNETDADK